MASTAALSRPAEPAALLKAIQLIPGLLLLAAVGLAGKWIEQTIARYGKSHHLALPNIEYVLWPILIGLILSNTVGISRLFRAGVATTNSGSKPESCCSVRGFFWSICSNWVE